MPVDIEKRKARDKANYYKYRLMKLEQKKEYYQKNKQKILEKKILHRQTEGHKKSFKICDWKRQGIVDTDYSALYDAYLKETNCYICGNEFKNSRDRHLDHDHDTGEVRYICCSNCNRHFLAEKKNIW